MYTVTFSNILLWKNLHLILVLVQINKMILHSANQAVKDLQDAKARISNSLV